jgi:hypothetical protein
MISCSPRPRALQTLLLVATVLTSGTACALSYTCDQLADMAARFHVLKEQGYRLEDVTAGIQQGARGNPGKEALLGDLAIEIYIDSSIDSSAKARERALAQCVQ